MDKNSINFAQIMEDEEITKEFLYYYKQTLLSNSTSEENESIIKDIKYEDLIKNNNISINTQNRRKSINIISVNK